MDLSKNKLSKLKKSVDARNRKVTRDNNLFEKMSPAEKRVQIARDVIAQLAAKRLIATTGTWLANGDEGDLFTKEDVHKNPELQKILKRQKECTGCALGGMFMCAVERADELRLGDLDRDSRDYRQMQDGSVFKYMEKFFSREQLDEIEAAFEQGEGFVDDSNVASGWLSEVDDANERMRLIMENIVANKGKFNISKSPVQKWITPGYKG